MTDTTNTTADITTDFVEFRNRGGRRMVGCFDHQAHGYERLPWVLIPPAYGETKRDALTIAYFLVANGFNVFRYDATNHIGESEGEMLHYTLHGAVDDLFSALDEMERRWNASRAMVVASSLAARYSMRAAVLDRRIELLVSIVGVTDLQHTLKAVYDEDLIGKAATGEVAYDEPRDVLGFEVYCAFAHEAIRHGFHDLESTIADLRRIRVPVTMLYGERDAWSRETDRQEIERRCRETRIESAFLPGAMHQIHENPEAVRAALAAIVRSCSRIGYGVPHVDRPQPPPIRRIARQNRIEKERLKKRELTEEEERDFWDNYLTRYTIVRKSADYRDFIETINGLLGEIRSGEILLDAGCGNGHFGTLLFEKLSRSGDDGRSEEADLDPPRFIYVGIDFAENALIEAMTRHVGARRRLMRDLDRQKCIYVRGSLEVSAGNGETRRLRFADDSFDKICCSLVLSYVKDPLAIVRELMRVLKPGRKIVITSLKPHADLSVLYRNFLDHAESPKEVEDARRLISAAGRIRQKEGEGHYQFFTAEELSGFLRDAGAEGIETRRSLGDQANIAVGYKPGTERG